MSSNNKNTKSLAIKNLFGYIINIILIVNATLLSIVIVNTSSCRQESKSSDNNKAKQTTLAEKSISNDTVTKDKKADEKNRESQYDYLAKWSEILKKTVYKSSKDGVSLNKIKYSSLVNNKDFIKLYTWLETASVPKKYATKFAFWINAYNIYVFRLMSANMSSTSIMKIAGGKAFNIAWYKVAGKKRSLNEIEKGILKSMGNSGYHFAVVCAAVSCPDMATSAYTNKNVFWLIKSMTKSFFENTGKGLKLDNVNKVVYLSSLGKWYGAEFQSKGGFQKYAASFFTGKKKTSIENYTVKWLPYNWNKN